MSDKDERPTYEELEKFYNDEIISYKLTSAVDSLLVATVIFVIYRVFWGFAIVGKE